MQLIKSFIPSNSDKVFDKIIFYISIFLVGKVITTSSQWLGSIICMVSYIQTFLTVIKMPVKRLPYNNFIKKMYILFIILDFFCVIVQSFFRGNFIWGDEWLSFMSYFFTQSLFYPAFFLPLLFIVPIKEYSLKYFFKIAPILAFVSLVGIVININDYFNIALNLNSNNTEATYDQYILFSQVTFAIFFVPFLKNKKKYFIIWGLGIITLLLFALYARRGNTLYTSIYLFIAVFIYFYKNKHIRFFLIPCVLIIYLFSFNIYQSNRNSFFSNITDKGMTDSRSEVENYFVKDMFNSSDLWFGRGLNGKYYCPQRYISPEGGYEYVKYRYAIETGFYHLILKGGIIFACLYIFILGYTALLGLFKSKNTIVKIFAIWILLSLIELYPFGWPAFDLKYFFIWMGSVLCYNQQIRRMNNKQICSFLNIN